MKKKALFLSALLLFLLVPWRAYGKVSVSLSLDRTQASLEDSIRMVVKISGTRDSDSRPEVAGLDSFAVTSGGTSSRVQIINGKVSAGIDYTYFIQPQKAGTFVIGPATITVEGKRFQSQTAALTVVQRASSYGADRGPLFLTAALSKQQAYVEEQVIYTLKLFRRTKVGDISLDLPKAEDLSFKQLGKPMEYQSVVRGKTYHVLEIRYAVIPTKARIYGIQAARMNMTVFEQRRRSPRSLFDDPFFSFSSGRPITLSGEPVELNVMPLPSAGRPADFSGLVGTFDIRSKLEPSEVKAGESATLTVLLTGRGNVNRIPDLKAPELGETKVYADQPVLEVTPDENGLSGLKTMKWALVPEKAGQYQIPAVGVNFFDPDTRQYRTARTSPKMLYVQPGKEETVQAPKGNTAEKLPAGPAKKAIQEIGHDILPIHSTIRDLSRTPRLGVSGPVRWMILLAPLFIYMAFFFGLRVQKKSESALSAARSRKAARNLLRQCSGPGLSAGQLTQAFRDYLNDRLGLSLGSLTPEEAHDILRSRGVSSNTAQKLKQLLEQLEDAIYTGRAQEAFPMEKDLKGLIKQVEKEIR